MKNVTWKIRPAFCLGLVVVLSYLVSSHTSVAAERRVLMEKFTADWCYWCQFVGRGLNMLIEEFPDDVIAIDIHVSDPDETVWGLQRDTFYDVTGLPTTWVDGVESMVGAQGGDDDYENCN